MADVDDLVARVGDKQLRSQLASAIAELRKTRDFGLVFERHIPETVRLHNHPVRRGIKATLRSSNDKTLYLVERTTQGTATVRPIRRPDGSTIDPAAPAATGEVPIDELIAVAEFGDPVYPGLKQVGSISRGGDKAAHIVINGENHHVLQALQFTHAGKIDCIYIDPPYNSGARDWKYDNDYVDEHDAYRHSKWLAFMERRLKLAKKLLDPDDSVLVCTIDEKEYLRLGLLLEQVFADCRVQMVSITINPKGTARANEFSRVDEFAYFVLVGSAVVPATNVGMGSKEVRWKYLRRTDIESARGTVKGGKSQFYPIYVDPETQRIVKIGDPLWPGQEIASVPELPGAVAVFPIREDGTHMNWGLTGASLQAALAGGYVRVTPGHDSQPFTIAYLSGPNIKRAESGEYVIAGSRLDGSKIVLTSGGGILARPTTVWREKAHDAGAHGTSLLGALIPGRKFPFPKSLYAVEDALRLFVKRKPHAVVLDFFGGSGTTTHAIARLNRQDGGRRQSILVTNNEVSADEAKALRARGHQPGDSEWEAYGIFECITRPRVAAAITGVALDGQRVKGDYKFADEFPMADGFEENVEFLQLTYEDPAQIELDRAFKAIAPLLWLRAGASGAVLEERSDVDGRPMPYVCTERYGILFNTDRWRGFVAELRETVTTVFIVTDSTTVFSQVAGELRTDVEPVRLYERYLTTFTINTDSGA
ncbi:MAG: site-specific DNA-methyltransferase [Acidimicrobiia bacterium]